MKHSLLKFYVLRNTRMVDRAVARMREESEAELPGAYTFEVVDLRQRRQLGAEEPVFAVSTLTSELPPMLRTLVDDLLLREQALIGIHVSTRETAPRVPGDRRVRKIASDIPGFDFISEGGLPSGRSTLVAGTSGSAKTIFCAQFLVEGIVRHGEPGIFVTFEETPDDIRNNLSSFGWDIDRWEADGAWAFVDASPDPTYKMKITGEVEFDALIARIRFAAEAIGARRAALDSVGSIFSLFPDVTRIRYELFRLISALRELKLTAVVSTERMEEYGAISRHGIEEFVADSVVILRNVLEVDKRRRTIEILKMRGTQHKKGEFPFTIMPDQGIAIIPHSLDLDQSSSSVRVSSGTPEFDTMCGGGLLRDSVVLVSGPTGTGKTMLASRFANVTTGGERSLYFGFEESRQQLARNSLCCGVDFERMDADGQLKVICSYPESASLDDHLVTIAETIKAFKPTRLVLDSVSALERIGSIRGFRAFLLALTSLLKRQKITGLLTTTTPMTGILLDSALHASALSDTIVLLRLVEIRGETIRGISVLKMRGSAHDKLIRKFDIGENGLRIGGPLWINGGTAAGTATDPHSVPLPRAGEGATRWAGE